MKIIARCFIFLEHARAYRNAEVIHNKSQRLGCFLQHRINLA